MLKNSIYNNLWNVTWIGHTLRREIIHGKDPWRIQAPIPSQWSSQKTGTSPTSNNRRPTINLFDIWLLQSINPFINIKSININNNIYIRKLRQ
jgi:hypothetical protein